jgi:hypothetical protein
LPEVSEVTKSSLSLVMRKEVDSELFLRCVGVKLSDNLSTKLEWMLGMEKYMTLGDLMVHLE